MVNEVNNSERSEKDEEFHLEQANNRLMTTIAAKVYQSDKAEFIKNATIYGRTAAGQIAYMMRKFNRSELLTPDQAQDNSKELEQLRSNYEELEAKYRELEYSKEQKEAELQRIKLESEQQPDQSQLDKLQEKLEKVQAERDQLKKAKPDDSKLEELKGRPTNNQYDQLKQKLDKQQAEIDKLSDRLGDAQLRLQNANEWIEKNTGGMFQTENPGQF